MSYPFYTHSAQGKHYKIELASFFLKLWNKVRVIWKRTGILHNLQLWTVTTFVSKIDLSVDAPERTDCIHMVETVYKEDKNVNSIAFMTRAHDRGLVIVFEWCVRLFRYLCYSQTHTHTHVLRPLSYCIMASWRCILLFEWCRCSWQSWLMMTRTLVNFLINHNGSIVFKFTKPMAMVSFSRCC